MEPGAAAVGPQLRLGLRAGLRAVGLDDAAPADPSRRTRLADDYREPTVKITAEGAIAHRFRRIYR